MSELAATIFPSRTLSLRRAAGLCTGALILVLLGAALAHALAAVNVPILLVFAGGLTLIAFLLLTIKRYETAIAIGLLLMGVVRFQPAPPDIAFAVIMTVAALTGRFHLKRVPVLLRWIVAVLLIINVLSMVDVVDLTEALKFVFITLYLATLSLWLAAYVDGPKRARLVVVTWLIVAIASAIVSIAALNLPLPGRSFILGSVDNGERAAGLFKDPNVFGPFLIPIALIVLEQRLAPKTPRLLRMGALTTWLALFVLTLGVIFSYSRAAWANLAIGLAVMLGASSLRRAGARRALRAGAVLLLMGALAAVVLSATGSISFLEHRAQLQGYDTQRFAAQDFGWHLGFTHPVGIGPGQFEYLSPVASHSTFVRVFAEQGFIGLLVWMALLVSTLAFALRNVVIGRDTYGIGSTALLGAWCGLIFNSAVVDTLHWRHLWVVVALIWAGAARGAIRSPEESSTLVRSLSGRPGGRSPTDPRTIVQRPRSPAPTR